MTYPTSKSNAQTSITQIDTPENKPRVCHVFADIVHHTPRLVAFVDQLPVDAPQLFVLGPRTRSLIGKLGRGRIVAEDTYVAALRRVATMPHVQVLVVHGLFGGDLLRAVDSIPAGRFRTVWAAWGGDYHWKLDERRSTRMVAEAIAFAGITGSRVLEHFESRDAPPPAWVRFVDRRTTHVSRTPIPAAAGFIGAARVKLGHVGRRLATDLRWIRRARTFQTVVVGTPRDISAIRRRGGLTNFRSLSYPQSQSVQGASLEVALPWANDTERATRHVIQVGNSATPSNRHAEAFAALRHLSDSVIVWSPLSYGPEAYRDEVIRKGRAVFGQHFYPQTELLPRAHYDRFVAQSDVVVCHHHRQQGMYLIHLALATGAKLFVSSQASTFLDLHSEGFVLHDSERLDALTPEELTSGEAEHRRNLATWTSRYSDERATLNWTELIREELALASSASALRSSPSK